MANQQNEGVGQPNVPVALNARGYSDSILPTMRASIEPDNTNNTVVAHRHSATENLGTFLASKSTNREALRLPSFQALGISFGSPGALPTPPDESIIDLGQPVHTHPPPASLARSSSFPPTLPKTPSPDINELTSAIDTVSFAEASGSARTTLPLATGGDGTNEQEVTGSPNPSSEGDSIPSHPGWLSDAVEAVVDTVDLQQLSNVVYLLCHTQPCPLSNSTVEHTVPPHVTSGFDSLVSAVQNKIESTGRYIEITHAIPIKFNMGQIPNSPATTPGPREPATDYFSPKVFSKAVIAMGHADAMGTSVPSSPRPVVPPNSISAALLERYIPPSTSEEYLHLLSNENPSALVDRLFELSPQSGKLIFIYPTAAGAEAFNQNYLGPLLHPLLRTMCSIHHLGYDFGAGVGTIAAVKEMHTFESMVRKTQILLRKLSRGPAKYALIQSDTRVVQLDRDVWTEWWQQQERPRIKSTVDRYWQRGKMLPNRRDVTAATLVQDVVDGVYKREGARAREYSEYDPPRNGVEVGVFVIKRSA